MPDREERREPDCYYGNEGREPNHDPPKLLPVIVFQSGLFAFKRDEIADMLAGDAGRQWVLDGQCCEALEHCAFFVFGEPLDYRLSLKGSAYQLEPVPRENPPHGLFERRQEPRAALPRL